MKLRLATLFSGVGAIEEALKYLEIEYNIVFACDNGERYLKEEDDETLRINLRNIEESKRNKYVKEFYSKFCKKINYVKETFFLNHNIEEKNWYEDVRYMNFKSFKNKIDILVGGSPCQSFSVIGKRKGIEDARGTLFYDFIRAINDSKPRVFIYENVLGIRTIDKGNTWERMKEMFIDSGYGIKEFILNAKDFGIPQNRKRVFIVGYYKKTPTFELNLIELNKNIFDFLEKDFNVKYILGEKGFKFVTNYKYKNRAQVNKQIIMCQKANQQFNWNGDFIFFNSKKYKEAYKGMYLDKIGSIRKLTPRECFLLMGFRKTFLLPSSVPDQQLYRQAGNSIVVNILMAISLKIMEDLNEKD